MTEQEWINRPPCWGPNEHGEFMVDMSVEDFRADVLRALRDAWDQGYKWGRFDQTILRRTDQDVTTENPYREETRPL